MQTGPARLAALLVWLAAGSPAAAHPGDWPRFRGPNGSGVSDETALPARFGPDDVVWSRELPFGRSSPVLTEDLVLLTATEDGRLVTLCLDFETPSGRR